MAHGWRPTGISSKRYESEARPVHSWRGIALLIGAGIFIHAILSEWFFDLSLLSPAMAADAANYQREFAALVESMRQLARTLGLEL